jgi:hypothetical protein
VWGASNGRLIDVDHLVYVFDPIDAVKITRHGVGTLELGSQGFIEDLDHQGRLARS